MMLPFITSFKLAFKPTSRPWRPDLAARRGYERRQRKPRRTVHVIISKTVVTSSVRGFRYRAQAHRASLRTWHAAFEAGGSGQHRNKEVRRSEGCCAHS